MLGHSDRQCEEHKGTYRMEGDKRSLPDVTCPIWRYLHTEVCPLHGPGTPLQKMNTLYIHYSMRQMSHLVKKNVFENDHSKQVEKLVKYQD